jgi:AcrR family transcriptional regulator
MTMTMKSREKLDTATRREQIAQAALNLVGSRGLGALRIAVVARQVGLVPSAIYRHFASKEDLLDAVIDLIGSKLQRNLQKVRAENEDPVVALGRLALLHAQLIRENQAIPRIILSEEIQAGGRERRQRILRSMGGYLAGIADLVRAGQRRKRIRADVEPDTASLLFLGLIQPAGVLWFLTDGEFDDPPRPARLGDPPARDHGGLPAPVPRDAGRAEKPEAGMKEGRP